MEWRLASGEMALLLASRGIPVQAPLDELLLDVPVPETETRIRALAETLKRRGLAERSEKLGYRLTGGFAQALGICANPEALMIVTNSHDSHGVMYCATAGAVSVQVVGSDALMRLGQGSAAIPPVLEALMGSSLVSGDSDDRQLLRIDLDVDELETILEDLERNQPESMTAACVREGWDPGEVAEIGETVQDDESCVEVMTCWADGAPALAARVRNTPKGVFVIATAWPPSSRGFIIRCGSGQLAGVLLETVVCASEEHAQ